MPHDRRHAPGSAARALRDVPVAPQPLIEGRGAARRRMSRLRNRHESILQSVADGIFGLDADGVATFVNPAAAQAVGWRVDELVGRHMHEVVHHSRADGTAYPVEACPIHASLHEGTEERVEDEVFFRKDGSSFPVEYTATPMREGAEIVGTVVIFSDVTARLEAEEELRESERRNRSLATEQAALHRVAAAVAADADSEEIFALVGREVGALVGADSGRVVSFRDRDDPLDPDGALVRVRTDERPAAANATGRAEVAAPVWVGATLWGAVVATSTHDVPEGSEDRLAGFAELVGMAIANAESRDRIVSETAATILEGRLDVDATLRAVAEAAQRALGSDRASCYVYDPDTGAIAGVHTTASDATERAFLERSVGTPAERLPLWAIITGQPDPLLIVEDVEADARIAPKLAAKLRAGAFVGVRLEHPSLVGADGVPTFLGSLFMSFRQPQRLTARALTAARSLGGLAALAIGNARLHAQTLESLASAEHRATRDPLTGLANHRTFHETLQVQVERASAAKTPLGLVLLDLDHFKEVNDTHGHQAGDRVLAEVGQRLLGLARDEDLVARIGGEEFAMILPGTDGDGALAAAERARAAIGGRRFEVGALTVSAGVCELAAAGDAAGELLELADGALYWAKANGRDSACRYSPEVVTDLSAHELAERLGRLQAMGGLRALARAVDAKDPSTQRHSERVATMAAQLATAVGWPHARAVQLREAGLLHDVGKIGVPDVVLFKPGPLTPEEYEQVKLHAALSANIAAEVLSPEQVAWVRHHHERWDGGGYPDGLTGTRSPQGARILALADAWDVMTCARSYKRPLSRKDAIGECRSHAGGQFDPALVEVLVRVVEEDTVAGPVPGQLTDDWSGPDGLLSESFASFEDACAHVLEELRWTMGWELAFLTRIRGDVLEVVATSGSDLVAPGTVLPLQDAFCHRMLRGSAPPACGHLSHPDSGYADTPARIALAAESYSGHPVLLPDGSVFGTLCALDRRRRTVSDEGRRMGSVLAELLAWELRREELATALGRARVEVAGAGAR